MTIETDLKEIRNLLSTLNKKIDVLIEDKESLAYMVLAENSLKEFLEKEPDIYIAKDVRAKVNCSRKEKSLRLNKQHVFHVAFVRWI